ncbi:hypothetical protein WA158_008279 [Blastocystis sp. Blastoise]
MKFILSLFLISVALSLAHSNAYYQAQFGAYLGAHQKSYDEREYRYRQNVFAKNLDYINEENTKGHSYTLGLTQFTDLTNEEFKAKIATGLLKDNLRAKKEPTVLPTDNLPESVDWREKNAVTPIKNQGECGSCWAFSTVGSIEGAYAVKTGKLYNLAEQQLVDCDTRDHGCWGGKQTWAFGELMNTDGICETSEYPYKAERGECQKDKVTPVVAIQDYNTVPTENGLQLKAALARAPVAVSISAGDEFIQHYTGGVFDNDDCFNMPDHAVLATGYGISEGKPFVWIKNSWGEDWGMKGYMQLVLVEEGEGVCALNVDCSYPIVKA